MASKWSIGCTENQNLQGLDYFTPVVDIDETTDEVVLLCDMPGVKPADVDVQVENRELTLHGKVAPRSITKGSLVESEFAESNFHRTFAIAPEIDIDKIAAEYGDGVLTVHLPKQEKL